MRAKNVLLPRDREALASNTRWQLPCRRLLFHALIRLNSTEDISEPDCNWAMQGDIQCKSGGREFFTHEYAKKYEI